MNQNHTFKAVFVKALAVSITPTDSTINLGDSVTFNSAVTGGTKYSYQWCVGSNKVPGAVSPSWAFTPTSIGTYYAYLNVTDFRGRIAISNTARVVVQKPPTPVGGYSVILDKKVSTPPIVCYATLLAALGIVISIVRRKKK